MSSKPRYIKQTDHVSCGSVGLVNVLKFHGEHGTAAMAKDLYEYTGDEPGTCLRLVDKWLHKRFSPIYIMNLTIGAIDSALWFAGCILFHYEPEPGEDAHYALIVEKKGNAYLIINHWDENTQAYCHAWVSTGTLVGYLRRANPEEGSGWAVFSCTHDLARFVRD